MTKKPKCRKLSWEILGLIVLSAAASLVLFFLLSRLALVVAESYCFYEEIPMTEFEWLLVDRLIFGTSAVLSCGLFSLLFLLLLKDRIAYIRKITAGIGALHQPEKAPCLPLEWNNELTELAGAINDMAQTQQKIREKERALAEEKEQLIRTLSHDIRTPLTSILAYADYLSEREDLPQEEQKAHLRMIRKKAEQIRELSAILLDGNRRNPEYFENGKLLFAQVVAEFREELEDGFDVKTDFSVCDSFSGHFDVQELRRIFDNLSSNVAKYADPQKPVVLEVCFKEGGLLIRQSNGIRAQSTQTDGYQIGLNSIRRIAQFYNGAVSVENDQQVYKISVFLSNL